MRLRLENFDGPFDLLLHLIKVQEINVFNIPIVLITEQFLSFLRHVPDLDFHQAGEYLAMAAQLIEIKALFLVPALQNTLPGTAQALEDIPEEDPRRPLVEQLLAYESIKAACLKLDSLKILGRDVFPSGDHKRNDGSIGEFDHPIKGTRFELVIAFERVLLRFAAKRNAPSVSVKAQKITIESKMRQVKARFHIAQHADLTEFFEDCESRYELIVVIMAILELCKAGQLVVNQDEIFGPITVSVGKKFEEDAPDLSAEEMAAQKTAQKEKENSL